MQDLEHASTPHNVGHREANDALKLLTRTEAQREEVAHAHSLMRLAEAELRQTIAEVEANRVPTDRLNQVLKLFNNQVSALLGSIAIAQESASLARSMGMYVPHANMSGLSQSVQMRSKAIRAEVKETIRTSGRDGVLKLRDMSLTAQGILPDGDLFLAASGTAELALIADKEYTSARAQRMESFKKLQAPTAKVEDANEFLDLRKHEKELQKKAFFTDLDARIASIRLSNPTLTPEQAKEQARAQIKDEIRAKRKEGILQQQYAEDRAQISAAKKIAQDKEVQGTGERSKLHPASPRLRALDAQSRHHLHWSARQKSR